MLGALYLAGGATDAMLAFAQEFTPRVEVCGPGELLLDLRGLTRLFGDPHALARELQRAAAARGLRAAVAVAGTGTAARLLARSRHRLLPADVIVVESGAEAAAVASLPLALLAEIANDDPRTVAPSHPLLSTFRRWGLRTLGDLAALPAGDVAARLGAGGLRWRRLAEGRDLRPLQAAAPEERFEQAIDLEWPIDGLEPLSFVLARLLEPLSAHLERRGRGAAVLRLQLRLVTRAVHERALELPAPMRDARTLRTLLLLDLESHPPPAAIDRVVVAVDPAPARVLQFSLLQRPLPSPEQLSTLMARLSALMGEGRCGSPVEADAWRPGAFGVKPFEPRESRDSHVDRPQTDLRGSVSPWPVEAKDAANHPALALRRFRFPVAVRVRVEHDRPVQVTIDRRGLPPGRRSLDEGGGRVEQCAGPWRTSGGWWAERFASPWAVGAWDRDEWDVTLADRATCRIYRDRATGAWFLEGLYD